MLEEKCNGLISSRKGLQLGLIFVEWLMKSMTKSNPGIDACVRLGSKYSTNWAQCQNYGPHDDWFTNTHPIQASENGSFAGAVSGWPLMVCWVPPPVFESHEKSPAPHVAGALRPMKPRPDIRTDSPEGSAGRRQGNFRGTGPGTGEEFPVPDGHVGASSHCHRRYRTARRPLPKFRRAPAPDQLSIVSLHTGFQRCTRSCSSLHRAA